MARQKRTSQVLETAHQRMAGLNSITPPPDFGTNLTLASYMAQINAFSAKLDTYNQMIAALDDMQNQVDDDETSLRELNKRMLSAAEAHFGPDSSQYEQAGGKRQSERKRPTRKTPANPVS
ncbi:MAG: hypothetical protein WBV94_04875 [Blastocatellia bacterium]